MTNTTNTTNMTNMTNIDKSLKHDDILKDYDKFLKQEEEIYNKHVNSKGKFNLDDTNEGLQDINNISTFIPDNSNINIIKNDIKVITDKLIKDNTIFFITGASIRSILIDSNLEQIKREMNIYLIKSDGHNNINKMINMDNIKSKDDNIFVTQIIDYSITIDKNIYNSIQSVLFNRGALERICFYNNKFMVSNIFMLDYYKLKTSFIQDRDPYLNICRDILNVYDRRCGDNDIKNIIDKISKSRIDNISKKIIEHNLISVKSTQNNNLLLTPIEYSIYKYINESNNILKESLKVIIASLSKYIYIRNPIYFLQALDINDIYLYKIVDCNRDKYKYNNYSYKNSEKDLHTIINSINMYIITELIKNDDTYVLDYLKKIEYIEKLGDKKMSKKGDIIIRTILDNNSYEIIDILINDKYVSIHNKLYLILMSENINLMKKVTKDNKLLTNYVEDIVNNGLLRSFYYLLKLDLDNVINYKNEDGDNILHMLTDKNKSDDILRLVMKLNDGLINEKNKLDKTPLHKFAKYGLESKINIVLKHKSTDYKIKDKYGNTFLHHLCKRGYLESIDSSVRIVRYIINSCNKYGETPIMVACKNKHENVFYLLKNIGADLNIKDKYGNTIYHYICMNGVCCGSSIPNILNNYNYTPKDYCKIDETYYNFMDG
jgi:ankyrin repeat protein